MIPICLATDDNYVHYTMMCIYDIVIRQDPSTELQFYILEDRLSEDSISQIHQLDDLTTIIHIPVDSSTIDPFKEAYTGHLTTTELLRVNIPIMDEFKDIERLLWLDSDVLCRRDITSLYNWDMKGKAMAMSRGSILLAFADPGTVPWRYSDVNSGVALMDLPKLRELNYTSILTSALRREHDAVYEKVLDEAFDSEITRLPPICNVPYHNFVFNQYNTKMFCRLDRWNTYHDTSYESFHEIFDQAYFFHFHEGKSHYLLCPQIKAIYRTSEQRLADYLSTKKKMEWHPEDDRVFLDPCEDIIFAAVELVQKDLETTYANIRKQNGELSEDATVWPVFFNKIITIHNHNTMKRSIPVYHEMNRVGMIRFHIVEHHYSVRSVYDEVVYRSVDHMLFDKVVQEHDRYKKVNQALTYLALFHKLLDDGVENVLICEDDVVFLRDYMTIRLMMEHLPPNWDYIKFERVNHSPELHDQFYSSITEGEYFHKNYTGGYFGTACCGYSRKAMELACKILEEQLLPMDLVLENREDKRLNDLHRFVSAQNLVIEAGRPINPNYKDIAKAEDYWSTGEYLNLAEGEL